MTPCSNDFSTSSSVIFPIVLLFNLQLLSSESSIQLPEALLFPETELVYSFISYLFSVAQFNPHNRTAELSKLHTHSTNTTHQETQHVSQPQQNRDYTTLSSFHPHFSNPPKSQNLIEPAQSHLTTLLDLHFHYEERKLQCTLPTPYALPFGCLGSAAHTLRKQLHGAFSRS